MVCTELQPHLDVVGLFWQLILGIVPGQNTAYFDDITDPNGLLVINFEATELAVEQLRVLEPHGPLVAGFLNNTLEVSAVVQAAAAGDDAARLAAIDEIDLITGGTSNAVNAQFEFGEALVAAGC